MERCWTASTHMRSVALGGSMVLMLLLGGCSDADSPAAPDGFGAASNEASANARGSNRGPARLSERLAHAVPSFGGAFVDAGGTLNIHLTNPGAAVAMRAAMNAELRSLGRAGMPVRMVDAEYSFRDLDRWIGQLTPALTGPGLVFTEIDERSNRLRIGIANESSRSSVQEALSRGGIPHRAALIEITARPELFSFAGTLRSRVSPLTAGAQIMYWTSYGERSTCTYGPNVLWQGARHMLVNSHCTPPMGGSTTGTSIWQPKIPTYEHSRGKYQVGEEFQDPAWRGDLYGCVSGYVCRYSDAALVAFRYGDRDWNLGGVMRTQSAATLPSIYGDLDINMFNPTFELTGIASDLLVGDVVNKVGRTTGWTRGTLESTCRNIFDELDFRGYLCSGVVKAGGGKGDSGSPVFWTTSGGQHRLAGMLFGGVPNRDGTVGDNYYFSNWQYIDYELGIPGYADLQAIEAYPFQPAMSFEDADAADTPPAEEPCVPTGTEITCTA